MNPLVARVRHAYAKGGMKRIVRYAFNHIRAALPGGYSLNAAYTREFFQYTITDGQAMADFLAPRLADALGLRRVLDLGCGAGHWVAAFLKCSVDAYGVEGSHHARPMLLCPEDRVLFADLRRPIRWRITSPVDLVISLEVAEHIEPRYAPRFVDNLVRFRPARVMMTAATPGQTGQYHVNERPPGYWVNLLGRAGYQPDEKTRSFIERCVDEAKASGTYIPFWMPKNLMVFGE